MAYRILYGDEILWEPYSDNADAITDASMTVSVNAAKYLDFTMPPTHHLYNIVSERSEMVWLYSDDKIIYKGFISKISLDMEGYKSISCTSVIDYLGDTHVRDYSTIEGEQPLKAPTSMDGLFQWYIDQHNANCMDSRKRFRVGVNQAGVLDENNYVYRSSTQFPTTADEISDKILASGGYIFERYEGEENILDFYADAHEANTQVLDFGVNITDFAQERSAEEQYTAVYATGYTPDPPEDDPDKEMKPISLSDIQNGGSPYNSDYFKLGDILYSVSGVQRYGYREYHYSNDDITTTDYLLKAAGVVLTRLLSPTITLDVKAVDMALFMDNGYDHLQLGQAVRVRSKPHNVDEYLMISAIDLDLQDPGNTSYTIGTTYDTLTGQQSSYLKSLNAGINSSLDAVSKLDDQTKQNAMDTAEADRRAREAEEAAKKAQTAAETADGKAEEAKTAADKAAEDAAGAISDAKKAADDAAEASKKADNATEKISLVESTLTEISGDTATAIKNAKDAQDAAEEAKTAAGNAYTEIGKVQSQVENINTEISNVKQDATDLRDDLSGQITTVKNTMEADYTRKTDLTETTNTLRNEISESAAGVIRTVSQDYATKKELQTTTDATSKNAQDLTNAINKFNSDVDNLQGQIDGAIETWFYEVDPTASNEPAKNWTTDALKKVHLGDLYYNTKSGYCWRYQLQNGSYSWSRITDVDVTKALADAAKAQDTADNKRRVFVATPKPPYEVGDLWTQGSGGDIMRCQTAKTSSQSYAAADWVKASKYTDDTAVTNLSNTVKTTYSTKTEVQQLSDKIEQTVSSLETVEINLEAAQTSADNAKKAADAAAAAAKTADDKAKEAAINLATAEANLKNLQSQADASNEQIAAAKAEVEKAKTAAADANTAATNAQATADAAKANAKTAQDDVNALKNRVTAAETSIKQNSEAIALRATKTEVTSAINDIKIGGTNLLENSEFFKLGEEPYTSSTATKYTNSYFDGQPGYFCSDTLYYQINMSGLTNTSSATISFDIARSSDAQNVIIVLQGDSTEHIIGKTGVGSWNRLYYSFIPPANGLIYIRIYCNNTSGTNTGTGRYVAALRHIKLEKGNKPTDWSPAPEDTLNEAKTYSDAQLTVKANEITQSVNSIKSTTDSLGTRMTTAEAGIKNNADAITLRATKSELESNYTKNLITSVSGNGNSASYLLIATFTIKSVYTNCGLRVVCTNRSNNQTTYNIRFASVNSLDPNVASFTCLGTMPAWIAKTATSTWNLYVKKSEAWDTCYVVGYSNPYPSSITVSWKSGTNQNVTTLPTSNIVEATAEIGTNAASDYYTKTETNAQIKVSADSIKSEVSSVKTTANSALSKATSVEQTASDLTTKITTAQTTANTANTTANAAKTSTNTLETLIRQSGDGVEVAKKVNGSYTSTKTLMSNTGFSIKTSDDSKTLGSFTSNGITLGDTMAGLYTKVTTDGVAIMKPGAVVSGQEATKQVGYFSKDGVYLNGRSCQISSNSAMTYPTTTISSKGDVTIRNNSESAILTDSAFMQMTRYRDYASGGRTYNYESVDIDAYCNKKYAAITVSAGTSYTTTSGASTATGLSRVQVNADDIYLGTSSSADTFVKGRFAVNDQYMNDFVIAEGESTTTDGKWSGKSWRWRWIKTKSGKCFAWGECDFNISCTYSWGSGYYDSVQPVYPFNLKNWNIQATVVFAGGGIGHTCIYDDTSTQAPMYIWSAVYQTTGTMYPKVFVEGTLA